MTRDNSSASLLGKRHQPESEEPARTPSNPPPSSSTRFHLLHVPSRRSTPDSSIEMTSIPGQKSPRRREGKKRMEGADVESMVVLEMDRAEGTGMVSNSSSVSLRTPTKIRTSQSAPSSPLLLSPPRSGRRSVQFHPENEYINPKHEGSDTSATQAAVIELESGSVKDIQASRRISKPSFNDSQSSLASFRTSIRDQPITEVPEDPRSGTRLSEPPPPPSNPTKTTITETTNTTNAPTATTTTTTTTTVISLTSPSVEGALKTQTLQPENEHQPVLRSTSGRFAVTHFDSVPLDDGDEKSKIPETIPENANYTSTPTDEIGKKEEITQSTSQSPTATLNSSPSKSKKHRKSKSTDVTIVQLEVSKHGRSPGSVNNLSDEKLKDKEHHSVDGNSSVASRWLNLMYTATHFHQSATGQSDSKQITASPHSSHSGHSSHFFVRPATYSGHESEGSGLAGLFHLGRPNSKGKMATEIPSTTQEARPSQRFKVTQVEDGAGAGPSTAPPTESEGERVPVPPRLDIWGEHGQQKATETVHVDEVAPIRDRSGTNAYDIPVESMIHLEDTVDLYREHQNFIDLSPLQLYLKPHAPSHPPQPFRSGSTWRCLNYTIFSRCCAVPLCWSQDSVS
eukprot:comp23961_c0_seq1/m.42442 comp23961_c0_seq1/g.42442  ORF comp23961_c0_seq1/g.42442 comp23961_c0_seq1/m.42442 type:complete len:625 (-) comp23961_c0_seq1:151-2025(-)